MERVKVPGYSVPASSQMPPGPPLGAHSLVTIQSYIKAWKPSIDPRGPRLANKIFCPERYAVGQHLFSSRELSGRFFGHQYAFCILVCILYNSCACQQRVALARIVPARSRTYSSSVHEVLIILAGSRTKTYQRIRKIKYCIYATLAIETLFQPTPQY